MNAYTCYSLEYMKYLATLNDNLKEVNYIHLEHSHPTMQSFDQLVYLIYKVNY